MVGFFSNLKQSNETSNKFFKNQIYKKYSSINLIKFSLIIKLIELYLRKDSSTIKLTRGKNIDITWNYWFFFKKINNFKLCLYFLWKFNNFFIFFKNYNCSINDLAVKINCNQKLVEHKTISSSQYKFNYRLQIVYPELFKLNSKLVNLKIPFLTHNHTTLICYFFFNCISFRAAFRFFFVEKVYTHNNNYYYFLKLQTTKYENFIKLNPLFDSNFKGLYNPLKLESNNGFNLIKLNGAKPMFKYITIFFLIFFENFFKGKFYAFIFFNKNRSSPLNLLLNYLMKKFFKFQIQVGKGFFLNEMLYIFVKVFLLKDLVFLKNWIITNMERMPFDKHKKFLYNLKILLRSLINYFFKLYKTKGFYFSVKGKISVSGNARTRKYLIKYGYFNFSGFKCKTDVLKYIVRTKTGSLGITSIITYT